MSHDYCVTVAAIGGIGAGFLLGYNYCRHVLRSICETEAGIEVTCRVFGEVTPHE